MEPHWHTPVTVPRVSGTHIITSFPGIEFFDVTNGRETHDSWLRGARLHGFMPANGLLYLPPHPCACYMQGKPPGNRHQMYLVGEREVLFAAPKQATDQKTFLWTTPGDIQVRGMVLAGEAAEKRLFVAGARGDWVISQDAYEGKQGNVLRIVSVADGETIAEHALPALPVFDGLSAAQGRLYVSLTNGSVLCLSSD